jgi:CheY-like chemotaxis protein
MTPLEGLRILIVEDEMLLALDLEELLGSWGAKVLGPVSNVPKALALLLDEKPDAATLDMNLSGVSSLPIAIELAARKIPFVVVSGYNNADTRDDAFQNARFVNKPFKDSELLTAFDAVLG